MQYLIKVVSELSVEDLIALKVHMIKPATSCIRVVAITPVPLRKSSKICLIQ